MTNKFREFIQKVGSGTHTSDNLTRAEAATATKMMLLGEATPAQIGAFLIAHRIKRLTQNLAVLIKSSRIGHELVML